MKYSYELNVSLFELCVVLSNSWRWKGLLDLKTILEKNEAILDIRLYNFFDYGLTLLIDGRSPEMLNFLLNEAMESANHQNLDHINLKDFRLIKQTILWMQLADNHSIQELANALDDQTLRRQYKDWCQLNEYQNNLKFSDTLNITPEQRLKLMKANTRVFSFYNRLT
jgi:hypothetical protein